MEVGRFSLSYKTNTTQLNMMKIDQKHKVNKLTDILRQQFGNDMHLARIKFIALFIISLCKVQTVGFEKLANAFDCYSESSSNLRRIQRFMAKYQLDSNLIAQLIFSLLPDKNAVKLSLDRTNWQFGSVDINILMLGVIYKGVAFPLMFSMLDKRGNSNTEERIQLIDRFIKLFGSECIDCLMADREFVGRKWIGYLNEKKIRYHIRIRNNFKVLLPRKNSVIKAGWLFNDLRLGEFKSYHRIVKIGGEYCYLSACKAKNKNGVEELVMIVSYNEADQAQCNYKLRWQIETCFKAMKTSGFNIEKTHLQDLARIEKLTLLVMIAFVWSYKVGIFLHENVKRIKIKKHGRRAKSIVKHGLSYIANTLLNSMKPDKLNICSFLSCT